MGDSPRHWRHWGVRLYRAGVLVAVVVVLRVFAVDGPADSSITIEQVLPHFPTATTLEVKDDVTWVRGVHNERRGYAVKTLPMSEDVIGYSGPTDVLIALDRDGEVLGASLLSSGDTEEHVEAVREEEAFLNSFIGWKWSENNDAAAIDAVSGATLTSLAIVESVTVRLGGDRPSLKFPNPVSLETVQRVFPEAAELDGARVLDGSGVVIGTVLRSAPHSDTIVGYQGPSDAVIGLDPESRVVGITIGHSYESQRYVDDVRKEKYFRTLHQGKTMEELAELDLDSIYADAVSGATMTSIAMVEAAADRAKVEVEEARWRDGATPAISIKLRDAATLAAIVFACIVAFTRHRAKRRLRIALQLYLIIVVGYWAGDMLSLALFGGWALGAVPLKSAPGLVALVAAAFVIPWATGKPIYCQNLCPHGAAQEWLFRIIPGRVNLPNRLRHILRFLPLVVLVAGGAVVASGAPVSLSSLEPFDAWVLGVGGVATMGIAIVGLAASAFVPLAYCKYGCPTGLILAYTRTNRHEHGLGRRDLVAGALVLLAFLAGAW